EKAVVVATGTGQVVLSFPGRPALTFSPDGKGVLSAGPGGELTVWNLATRRPQRRLQGPPGPLTALALHPDGRTLAAAGDKAVTVWDTVAARTLQTLRHSFRVVEVKPVMPIPDGVGRGEGSRL